MVKILADSTCDLSPELIARYGIGIIPLYVHLGEEEFRDGVDITPEELFKWSDEHNTTPKTAAPGIEDIEEFLDKDGSDEYVIFTISSSMSSSYTNCTLAADDLEITDRVFVIDSQNLSTGIALLVLKAAHPSPLSAYNGFFGCRHFSRTNEFLQAHGVSPVDWQIENRSFS